MADIVFDNVTKRYPDGYEAVKGINLEIADGEFMILVGPSGCGKSTALNMIAGLEDISSGELRIGGEVVNDKAPRDRDIAMVFQSYALYPHMSVRANMAFPLTIVKTPKDEVNRRVEEAADLLDLRQHLDRKPSQLSGGQRQRVAMGRAIVRSPKAFLMDEPLSNLDAKLRVQMRTSVARLQDQLGTTMVYVTHDQTEAMTLGDRVAIMRAGILQQVGSPMELYNEPNNLFVAGFIGSPSMNFLPATVEGDTIKLPMVDVKLPQPRREQLGRIPEGKGLIAGIRPEDFEDAGVVGASNGATFKTRIDVLEAMGSEFYAHFTIDAKKDELAQSDELRELQEDQGGEAPGEGFDVVARLDQTSTAKAKSESEIWINTEKIQLFDPESGKSLTAG
jgi:multiple sugar transport system ATP-binding protein